MDHRWTLTNLPRDRPAWSIIEPLVGNKQGPLSLCHVSSMSGPLMVWGHRFFIFMTGFLLEIPVDVFV